jgi:DDE superfamily endonuclease
LSLLALANSRFGICVDYTTPKSVKGLTILQYFMLVFPLLPPGAVLVMDNASIHHSRWARLRALALRHGVEILFLPPYHPWWNPIEFVFSVLKRRLKRGNIIPLADQIHRELAQISPAAVRNIVANTGLYGEVWSA